MRILASAFRVDWLLAAGVAALLVAACTGDDEPSPTAAPTTPAATEAASPSPTQAPPEPTPTASATETGTATPTSAPMTPFDLYLSRTPESDDDPTEVFPVQRFGREDQLPLSAVEALIEGPTAEEEAQGYYSEWQRFGYEGESDCGGDVAEIEVDEMVATVRFCVQPVLIGTLADGRARLTMEETLKGLGGIEEVVILGPDENCLFDESGQNLCLQDAASSGSSGALRRTEAGSERA